MKSNESVKERIINAAWEMFYEKGYEQTTIMDIINKSETSKGSFYYYFASKATLLNTLSTILDNQYHELEEEIDEKMNSFDKLMELNYKMHSFMEEKIDYKLLANQYADQILKDEGSNLLDRNRYYYQIIARIVDEGQKKGEITTDKSVSDIVRLYSLCERALVTDWCMCNGSYSLGEYSRENMCLLFSKLKVE